MDLSEIIDKQATGIVKSLGQPSIFPKGEDTKDKKTKKKIFKTNVFQIISDETALNFSEFMNNASTNGYQILKEDSNWNEGVLTIVVFYLIDED